LTLYGHTSKQTIYVGKNLLYEKENLPILKYCNVSLSSGYSFDLIPATTNEFSPIEVLIIREYCTVHELETILSYVPQLRHLFVLCLAESALAYPCLSTINHLTHLSLNVVRMRFNRFESMIQNPSNQIQVLYFSIENEKEYLDAHRWEQLILSHLPRLRIFDINISYILTQTEKIVDYITMVEQFNSSFWFERHCFFEHHVINRNNSTEYKIILFSTNPYRYPSRTFLFKRLPRLELKMCP
jgi:hypothetical protein